MASVVEKILADMRSEGWSVAVHNDYRMNGKAMTFWLFTHPDGMWVKGEGETDAIALAEVWRHATDGVDKPIDAGTGALTSREGWNGDHPVPRLYVETVEAEAEMLWEKRSELVGRLRRCEATANRLADELDAKDKAQPGAIKAAVASERERCRGWWRWYLDNATTSPGVTSYPALETGEGIRIGAPAPGVVKP